MKQARKYRFFQIASKPSEEIVLEMISYLSEGYRIISAVGQSNSVQYIVESSIETDEKE